ncbi:MAG: hypothetical protein ACE5GI_08645 [Candidatus Aminicenantales bacterium]
MDEARFSIFESEIEAQISLIEEIYRKIEQRKKGIEKSESKLESLAYQLHNLYCAFEDLFKIVADFFDNTVEESGGYHAELVRRMSIFIKGIRPALLSDEAYRLLDSLRAFRHFFRHAYNYEIELRKVKIVLDDALRLKEIYPGLVKDFLERIRGKK